MKTNVAQVICSVACLAFVGAAIYMGITQPSLIVKGDVPVWGWFGILAAIAGFGAIVTDDTISF